MAASTLLQESQLAADNGDVFRAAIIKIVAEASPLMARIPFQSIGGDTLKYSVEGTAPTVAYRDVNESYTPNSGVDNPEIETLKIVGGEIEIDTATVATRQGSVSRQIDKKTKAMSQKMGRDLMKGTLTADRKGIIGIESRLVIGTDRVIENGSTSGGDALKISKLDELCDSVEGVNALVMLKDQRRSITTYLQNSNSIKTSRDEFGRQVFSYNDLPILIADQFGDTPALTNDEAGAGGGTTSCSIYALNLNEGYLWGLQNAPMRVKNFGEVADKPAHRVRIEWLIGLCLGHPRAAGRLRGIKRATAAVA